MVTISTQKVNRHTQIPKKKVTQADYDYIINRIKIDLSNFTFSLFGPDETIIFYGTYSRTFINDDATKSTIHIQRILCLNSGKTHSLIIDFLVPYSTIPIDYQIDIIKADESELDNLCVTYNLDLNSIRYIRKCFTLYWHSYIDMLDLDVSFLINHSFENMHKQFLQNRGSALFYLPT